MTFCQKLNSIRKGILLDLRRGLGRKQLTEHQYAHVLAGYLDHVLERYVAPGDEFATRIYLRAYRSKHHASSSPRP